VKLTTDQFQAITRHRYLGGPRPYGVPHVSVATLGAVEFHRVTSWWEQFDAWQGWLDSGKHGPRPNVWRVVPLFAWQLRSAVVKARQPVNMHPAPKPPPTQPPALPERARRYVNGIYAAQNPLAALSAKPKYTIMFTADPGYDAWASGGAAKQARDAGHLVGVWYVPTEVSKGRADEVAQRLGTDLIAGQAETLDQFWASVDHGRDAVIGNLSACFDDPKAADRIRSGAMVFVNEFYWNQDRSRQPDNHGLPVPSLCVACYDGHGDSSSPNAWEPHIGDYQAAGYTWLTMSAYGPGMSAQDYAALP
jgi:hypothetical protein